MLIPNRHGNSGAYRYGFNGMEKDDEIKGEGNGINYEARFFDPRVGRFLSVDPLTKKFPWYTPYQFAGNTPIWAVDLDGEEEYFYQLKLSKNNKGKTVIAVVLAKEINYSFIPDAIEPNHFNLRDLDGSLLEFDFETKKELMQAVHGKTLVEIRAKSGKALDNKISKAIEGALTIEMVNTIGRIENGALNHDFGTSDDVDISDETPVVPVISISKTKYPQAALHIEEAQAAGHPEILTVNRPGSLVNRRLSLKGIKTKPEMDRDEYPPAMFAEGGSGASVKHIPSSDNRGAGSSMGKQLKGVPNGTKVKIKTH